MLFLLAAQSFGNLIDADFESIAQRAGQAAETLAVMAASAAAGEIAEWMDLGWDGTWDPSWGPEYRDGFGPGGSEWTGLSDWTGKTNNLAKTAPIEIPENAIVKAGPKAAGYEQISYKWNDSTYKYEARWHTQTPGAPAGSGNTWVVSRVTPGNSTGLRAVTHIYTGNGQWTTKFDWQAAITAYQNGTMTAAQEAMLKAGHWLAP